MRPLKQSGVWALALFLQLLAPGATQLHAQSPELPSFSLHWSNQDGHYEITQYGPNGPLDGGHLIRGMRLSPDPAGEWAYGVERQEVYQVRIDTGARHQLQSAHHDFSWPMGMAFNTGRDRVALVTLSGEGFFFEFDPATSQWQQLASMHNRDFDSLDYSPARDSYFGASTIHGNGAVLHVYELSPNGELLQDIPIFNATPESGSPYFRAEAVVAGQKIIVLLETERSFGNQTQEGESRIYLIDPETQNVTLAWQKDWDTPNPSVELVNPRAVTEFAEGDSIDLVARVQSTDDTIPHVTFHANDRPLGNGILIDKEGPVTLWRVMWHDVPAGQYDLTATVTLPSGVLVTSQAVRVRVGQPHNQPPTVLLTAPAEPVTLTLGNSLLLSATAHDPDGIPTIEFFADGQLLPHPVQVRFTDSGTLYATLDWRPAHPGRYAITARATDDKGAQATTQPIQVTVIETSTPHLTFALTFLEPIRTGPSLPGTFSRMYSLDGPAVSGRLLPGLRLVWLNDYYYGAEWHSVWRFNEETGVLSGLNPTGEGIPELSWPMGVAADTERNRIVLVSLGGEGFLYAYDPATETWSLISSMENRDVDSITYHPADDHFYAVGMHGDSGKLLKLTPEGQLAREIPLPLGFAISPAGYETELVSVVDHLVLLVEHEGFATLPEPGTESRIYLIDPRSGELTLTYRRLWQHMAPVVEWVAPEDGASLESPPSILLQIRALDTSVVQSVQFFANGENIGQGSGYPNSELWQLAWNPAPGEYILHAKATDVEGNSTETTPIRITVGPGQPLATAHRHLPEFFTAGIPFEVQVTVHPSARSHAYALQDRPPSGWVVSDITHGGLFDPHTGLVKFGPFTDTDSRVLSYTLLPPDNAEGEAFFSGELSADGHSFPIAGDSHLLSSPRPHPADLDPPDMRIAISELTTYAAAWKAGELWPVSLGPIPMDYVVRAGYLWQRGEAYLFSTSAGAPPLCWVPVEPAILAALTDGHATRTLTTSPAGTTVQIMVTPGASVSAYAVEEQLPPNATLLSVTEGGLASNGVLRWGPFYDSNPRTLTYTLAEPPVTPPSGVVSFNGYSEPVIPHALPALNLARAETGLSLRFTAPLPAPGLLETSLSLSSPQWEFVTTIPAGASQAPVPSIDPNSPSRFFRVRLQ